MPTYIAMGTFAQKGIKNIKDSPTRLAAARKAIKDMGGELKAFYYTMGQYDFVSISTFPSNESAMTFLFALGSLGNVKTETLVAISGEEAAELIKNVP
jgi:uncharacterized protein with GYD domain